MIISSRTREIIRIIAAEHGFITVHNIAEKMNVSDRLPGDPGRYQNIKEPEYRSAQRQQKRTED